MFFRHGKMEKPLKNATFDKNRPKAGKKQFAPAAAVAAATDTSGHDAEAVSYSGQIKIKS